MATVTLTPASLSQVYNGTPKVATATTVPGGLTVDFTYDGSAISPTNANTYAIIGTISDPNYQGTDSGTFIITKGVATLTLAPASLSQVYNGTPRTVSASTVPIGLTVDITYDGSPIIPTGANTYAVIATINNANWTGSDSGTLTVSKGAATVTLGSLNHAYDGTPKNATATTVPGGLTVDFTYDGSPIAPTNVGTYAVIGTINDTNWTGSASRTMAIGNDVATVTLGSLTQVYDGTQKTATATTSPAGLTVDFTYNGSPTAPANAGTYVVIGTVNNPNYIGSASGTLTISKAAATVTLANLSQTYDGTPKAAAATTVPAGLTVDFTYNGSPTMPTNAGPHAVIGTINDANYQGTASDTLTINKATATATLGSLSQVYNGTPKAATATTSPAGLEVLFTYDGSPTAPTNVGTYAVIGTINDPNYQGTDSGTFIITKGVATVTLAPASLSQVYNGTPRTVSASTVPIGLTVDITYDGSPIIPTDANTYAVIGTINNANWTGSDSGTLTISKGAATVTLGSLNHAYDGTPKNATATTVPGGLTVDFTYDGSPIAPTNVGTYAVIGTINDTNWTGSASRTMAIGNDVATVTLGSLSQVYDGTQKTATATTSPAGLTVDFTYNGSPTAPTNAGTYTVVGTVNDPNYIGSASGTLTISKAAATVTLANLSQTYDGTPKAAAATTVPAGLTVDFTYNGSPTAPTNAGPHAVIGTINDANYQGTASDTLTITKAYCNSSPWAA